MSQNLTLTRLDLTWLNPFFFLVFISIKLETLVSLLSLWQPCSGVGDVCSKIQLPTDSLRRLVRCFWLNPYNRESSVLYRRRPLFSQAKSQEIMDISLFVPLRQHPSKSNEPQQSCSGLRREGSLYSFSLINWSFRFAKAAATNVATGVTCMAVSILLLRPTASLSSTQSTDDDPGSKS